MQTTVQCPKCSSDLTVGDNGLCFCGQCNQQYEIGQPAEGPPPLPECQAPTPEKPKSDRVFQRLAWKSAFLMALFVTMSGCVFLLMIPPRFKGLIDPRSSNADLVPAALLIGGIITFVVVLIIHFVKLTIRINQSRKETPPSITDTQFYVARYPVCQSPDIRKTHKTSTGGYLCFILGIVLCFTLIWRGVLI